jgi:hypothetical protein
VQLPRFLGKDERPLLTIKIPNNKYVPELKVCLLLPHHWAQEAKDHYPLPRGTKMEDNDEALMLIWKQCKHDMSDNPMQTQHIR